MQYICEICGKEFYSLKFAKRCINDRLSTSEYLKIYHLKHRAEHLQYNKEYHKKNREKDLERKKKVGRRFYKKWFENKECANCHKKWNETNLVYHHIIPNSKIDGIGRLYWKNDEIIMKEIDKCIPLCRSCHMKLHCNIRYHQKEVY